MGTNYYLIHKEGTCPHCGHKKEPLHIGKSSYGWCFSLHVEPSIDDYPQNLREWEALFNNPDYHIEDEYGDELTVNEMMDKITKRSHPHPNTWDNYKLDLNSAEPGPNNLVRHKVDGRHCIGHGDGTWDYITGEFS